MHIASQTAARTEDGTAIAYRTLGTGPADVLFMHGWAGSGAYFDEMLRYLDLSGLRVTTVDLRDGRDGMAVDRAHDDGKVARHQKALEGSQG